MSTHINVSTNLKAAQIVDVLRSHPGKMMGSKSIADELAQRGIDVLPKTVSNYLSIMIKQGDYPQLTSKPRVGFIWNADETEFYAKKAEITENKSAYRKKSTVMRNSEGYSDPTCGAAIRNVEGEDPYARLGEVWSVKGANGLVEWFMILADWKAVKVGVPLYAGDYRSRIRVKVDIAGTTLYGDATNLRSKPSKYFDTYMGNVEDKKARVILNDVLKAVCDPDISPVVIETVMPANTITVDGVLYTEADIRSKLDTIVTLNGHIDAYTKTVDELDKELGSKKAAILDKESQISDLTRMNKDIMDANNGLRTNLISAKKSNPVVVQVDGEIYNEEDITAIIRARNTVRVGDKIYKASDICELLENKSEDSAPVPDKAYIDKVVAMATIYKQFFDAYCAGMAKGGEE